MPDLDLQPDTNANAPLYPAGHLKGLALDALIAERDRQRAAGDAMSLVRARLCTQEMIRRRLAAMAPTELAP